MSVPLCSLSGTTKQVLPRTSCAHLSVYSECLIVSSDRISVLHKIRHTSANNTRQRTLFIPAAVFYGRVRLR